MMFRVFFAFLRPLAPIVLLSLQAFHALGQTEDPIELLAITYAEQVEAAKSLVENPEKITGLERFRLAYSLPHHKIEDRIGRILLTMRTQEEVIRAALAKVETSSAVPARNGWAERFGLSVAQHGMKALCNERQFASRRDLCLSAVRDFLKVFDLRDAHSGFSGLPFYSLVERRFSEPEFQRQVIELDSELRRLAGQLDARPSVPVNESLYDLALKVTRGNGREAVELLGILTSRDVLITRYLKYLRSGNGTFVRAFGNAPLLVRLVADLDRRARASPIDVFSFPRGYGTATERNYYYWSSALVSSELKRIGYPTDLIERISLEFPRQYKTLRFIEAGGIFRSADWKRAFQVDSQQAMRVSGHGSRTGVAEIPLQHVPVGTEETRFEAFVSALKEPASAERQLKIDLLRSAIKAGSPESGKIQVLFYNFATSRIGLSHIKLVMDGRVYEIHRHPNADGGYLRERSLVAGLADAKAGYLPNGILEIQATDAHKAMIREFLEMESDANFRYSTFNKLLHSDSYNCGGIIYDAIRESGIALPPLARTHALPHQMFQKMIESLPRATLAGKDGAWFRSLMVPNFSLATLRPGSAKLPRTFSTLINQEFVNAEQQLSETTPLMSNKRHMIGKIIPQYSNTGKLSREFTPSASKTFELVSLMIPEEEAGLVLRSPLRTAESDAIQTVSRGGRRYIRFFIHPAEVENYRQLIEKYPKDEIRWIATPTSSARSLLVTEVGGDGRVFAVKLSLSEQMGGASRVITEENTVRGVVNSDLLAEIRKEDGGLLKQSGKSWDFLPEPASVLPMDERLGGYILRELPKDMASDIVIPWYALVSERKGGERWVDELLRYSGRSSKAEFVWNDLVSPLVELHTRFSIENGMTTEFHQQNVLIRIDRDTRRVKGLLLRDMDSFWVDHSLRTHRLHKPPVTFANWNEDARLFRFAYAPENHLYSYADILRTRAIEDVFKYVLTNAELKKVLGQADEMIVSRFQKTFPDAGIHNVGDLERGWHTLHQASITSDEARTYAEIRAMFDSQPGGRLNWKSWIEKWNKRKNVQKLRPGSEASNRCLRALFGKLLRVAPVSSGLAPSR